MSEKLFNVVFFGILQTGKDKETVMQNMAALFKTDASKLTPYFSGDRKIIKGKINAATAEKYKAALENAGMVIKIEPCEATQTGQPAKSQDARQTAGVKADQSNTATVDTGDMTMAPLGADVMEHPLEVAAQKIYDISNITMAEAGTDVIEHQVKLPAQNIDDISDITLAETGADIIEHQVKLPAQNIDDISDISMAEVGSDVLEQPQEVVPQKIDDISGISMAEPGSDLIKNPKPKAKAKIPDTSELSLDE